MARQFPWTHNLIILSQSKSREIFFIDQATQERWSKREIERQLKSALFERTILHHQSNSWALTKSRPEVINVFKDAYMLEFFRSTRES